MATPFSLLPISLNPNSHSPQFLSFSLPSTFPSPKSPIRNLHNSNFPNPRPTAKWRSRSSTNTEFLLSEAPSIDDSAEIILPPADDVSSRVVQSLLLVAFVGLSVLTAGVIYIAVTDFLQKREREKLDKLEAAASGKKKRGRKGVAAAARANRTGPRGFGQKIEEDDGVEGAD